jgi:hypothetical protein
MIRNMGGGQFAILTERGLSAIANCLDIPALDQLTTPAPYG